MNTKEQRQYTKELIDEYKGKHFRFLMYFLNGDYEDYVAENIDKIIYKNVFGRKFIRNEYKNINSEHFLLATILRECHETIEYVNQYLSVCLKEQGIQKVIDNNQSDHYNILTFAREWIKTQNKPFTADDLRLEYESTHDTPKQPKIYGGVFNTLVSEKLITQHGTSTSKRREAHCRLIRTWKSLCVSEELKSA